MERRQISAVTAGGPIRLDVLHLEAWTNHLTDNNVQLFLFIDTHATHILRHIQFGKTVTPNKSNPNHSPNKIATWRQILRDDSVETRASTLRLKVTFITMFSSCQWRELGRRAWPTIVKAWDVGAGRHIHRAGLLLDVVALCPKSEEVSSLESFSKITRWRECTTTYMIMRGASNFKSLIIRVVVCRIANKTFQPVETRHISVSVAAANQNSPRVSASAAEQSPRGSDTVDVPHDPQLRYKEDKGTTHLPAIHGGLLKPDVVEGTDDERVWSLPCWDLTETSKRDDGIDLLKDNQALQRLTGIAEKAKMDLSSLTQSNIRRGPQLVFFGVGTHGWFSLMEHTAVLVDEMMTFYQD
ncbi:hypothetical protein Syun_031250 [Stephania yunnanensis]|uniref:Uncharacterized protein n=1 Tax=Stephania yunnanensis TaxID=152371 RepID=A0AAP0DXD1_9MAGN